MNEQSGATKWIGQSVERLEDPPLVTGRGRFAGDINFARQLHMRMVRSNHAHANIVSIDTEAARALPGVVAVWTAADIADVPPIDFREGPIEKLAPYRQMMIGDLVTGPRSKVIADWAARQTYIALGNFMTASAALGIDTCPMEGIDPPKYDAILGLVGSGYQTVVACAAGYRSAADKYALAPKVRYPLADVVRHA